MDISIRAFQFREVVFPELRQQACDGFAAGANQLRDFFVGHCYRTLTLPVSGPSHPRRFRAGSERTVPKPSVITPSCAPRHRVRTVARQMLGGMLRGVRIGFEEVQHVVAPHEIQLTRLPSFHRQLIRTAPYHCMQAENFSASAMRMITVLPSREVVESLARPLARIKSPRDSVPRPEPRRVQEKRRRVLSC